MFNMFKKMFNMSKEATQSKWDNLCSNSLTAWVYSTSGEEHVASPPKVSNAKEIPKKGQKAAPKLVARKRVIPQKASALHDEGAMASDSDLEVEDYYIAEDDNESASSEYVPCINYPNDKVSRR